MKKTIVTIAVLFFVLLGKAQVTISSQLPASGILLKDQLWSLVLTNNSNDIKEFRIQLDVKDVHLGQSVMNASSGSLFINKGVKLLSFSNVQPIVYNYVAADFSSNYLPCGNYAVSYHVLAMIPGKGEVPVADEITRLVVAPLSPPQLVYPANESFIETTAPQLSWVPPVPMQMFSPLAYDIKIAAVENGQTLREAIEYNTPAYFNTSISQPTEKIGSSMPSLEKGKKYAWQVTARNGLNCEVISEIWSFNIGKDSVKAIVAGAPYIRISNTGTEVTIAHQGVVKMEFINASADTSAVFKVYKLAEKDKKQRREMRFELAIKQGSNFLSYDTQKKYRLEENAVYEICTENSRGEQWFMKFMPIYYSK